MMRKSRGFTLIELLVVIGIIALLIGILVPVLAGARKIAQRMKGSAQLRGIQNAMVIYSDKNNNWFAGTNKNGKFVDHTYEVGDTNFLNDAPTPSVVYWLLLKGAFITPDQLVSPLEDSREEYNVTDNSAYADSSFAAEFDESKKYSFAMLDIDSSNTLKRNWRNNSNGQIVVLCDRNTGDAEEQASIHNAKKWEGSVAWNDGHVKYEPDAIVATRYDPDDPQPVDHLFTDTNNEPDAVMVD